MPSSRNVSARIHPRLLTVAVALLHLLTLTLALVELDRQHYQTAKRDLIRDNFDSVLRLPTDSMKDLAAEACFGHSGNQRKKAIDQLRLVFQDTLASESAVDHFVLKDANGTVLLEEQVPGKRKRMETWSNSLFLSGFSGFTDLRVPGPLLLSDTDAVRPVARLQAWYGSPSGFAPLSELTVRYRWIAAGIIFIGTAILFFLYKYVLRPMEQVTMRLEASRGEAPQLIPRARGALETGYNSMALQALLQHLEEKLDPLLKPHAVSGDQHAATTRALSMLIDHFGADHATVAFFTGSTLADRLDAGGDISPSDEELLHHVEARMSSSQGTGAPIVVLHRDEEQTTLVWARVSRTAPDPALARTILEAGLETLLRSLAAAGALSQELFRRSREANIVLSRNLGHDLTNIIATAKLDLAALRTLLTSNNVPTDPTSPRGRALRTAVEGLLNSTRFLQEVVNLYRAFSFLKRPTYEEADLNELISGFLDSFRPTVSARVALQFHPDPHAKPLRIETRLLRLALFNLIQNAIDALKRSAPEDAPDNPMIAVTTHVDTENARMIIEVQDNGPGLRHATGRLLTPAEIPTLFRFGYSTKDREVNEGLGLAWVQTIVEEFHGGRLEAQNAPAGGAIFRILLPYAAARPATS